jgi:predicted nucleic acid-binding protein
MILADTSVWIDHFRGRLSGLQPRLDRGEIMIHPLVIGELLLSGVYRRPDAVAELRQLPAAPTPRIEETEVMIVTASLDGCGVGYVDSVILTAARLHPGARLWTLDRKLHAVAVGMSVAFDG